jgi:hypothetical protein
MTDEHAQMWAAKEGAEIERVPNSEEARTDVRGQGATFFHAQSVDAIERHFDALELAQKKGVSKRP